MAVTLRFERELKSIPALMWLGLGLGLLHLLSLLFWGNLIEQTLTSESGYCWPLWPNCEVLRPFPSPLILVLRGLWAALAVATAAAFFTKKFKVAWWLLLMCELLKLFVFSQDYRFMGNYHYILFVFAFIFLFVPDRARVFPLLWTLIYVTAGALKVNQEWLSGAALVSTPPWGENFLLELQAFVIFLELVIAWLLLSRSLWWFRFAVINFALFHLMSFFIVGYFYPAVCLTILAFLVLLSRQTFPLPRPQWSTRAHTAIIVLFLVPQIWFHLGSKDGSLTGVGRLWALNMFDVNSVCEAYGELRLRDGRRLEVGFTPEDESLRIHCDPLIFANFARQICAQVKRGDYAAEELVYQAYSRRSSDWNWLKVYDLKTDCSRRVSLWPQGESE